MQRATRRTSRSSTAGIAGQQADVAAQAIAAFARVAPEPEPFRPVIHGMLLTGGKPLYLSARVTGGRGTSSEITETPTWSPGDQDRRQVPRAVPGGTRPRSREHDMIAAILNLNHPAHTVH